MISASSSATLRLIAASLSDTYHAALLEQLAATLDRERDRAADQTTAAIGSVYIDSLNARDVLTERILALEDALTAFTLTVDDWRVASVADRADLRHAVETLRDEVTHLVGLLQRDRERGGGDG